VLLLLPLLLLLLIKISPSTALSLNLFPHRPQYERDHLGLRGLVPPAVKTLEAQVKRCLRHLEKEETNVRKNLYLQDLHNRNETLYFKVLTDNIEDMAPLVYTPTVGEVCTQFGWQFRRTRVNASTLLYRRLCAARSCS
jgi:hypothetical protein